MTSPLLILSFSVLGILLFLGGGLTWLYNRLITARNQMREGWSGIEVQLKRRHDLVPSLLACLKEQQDFEMEVLAEITQARSQALAAQNPSESAEAEKTLVTSVAKVLALSEDYPELSSAQTFQQFMEDLTEIEDHLQYARRYYNGSVRNYNNRVESFPSNLLAAFFRFDLAPFFEVSEASQRNNPSLNL